MSLEVDCSMAVHDRCCWESCAPSPKVAEDRDVGYSSCVVEECLVWPVERLIVEANCSMRRESAGRANTHGSSRTLAAVKASA